MPAPAVFNYPQVLLNITADVAAHPRDLGRVLASRYGVTRASSSNLIRRLEADGWITRSGPATHPVYAPGAKRQRSLTVPLPGLEEDAVWEQEFARLFTLPPNVRSILHYGFTEMTNNAVDHSAGSRIWLQVMQDPEKVQLVVADDGIGLFKRVAEGLDLADFRLAMFELAKGKLTTDPSRHTGEGVFFTSRMFDDFRIAANDLLFGHNDTFKQDWLLDTHIVSGTHVQMTIACDSPRLIKQVFDEYTHAPDDYGFSKTVVPMKLAQYSGDLLMSRSQAKRLMARFDRFQTVVLDFQGVTEIGQAFADEMFRVYARDHPGVELVPRNMTREVERMWLRAVSADPTA